MSDPTAEVPAIQNPKITDLYRILKVASDLSQKLSFSSYQFESLKTKQELDDYKLDSLFAEILSSEAYIDVCRAAFASAKQALQQHMTQNIFKQFES